MEKISTKDLQTLANIVAHEPKNMVKTKLTGWLSAKAENSDHVGLGLLCSLAQDSALKNEILDWVSTVTTPKPEFVYIPDIPAQMTDEQVEKSKQEPSV